MNQPATIPAEQIDCANAFASLHIKGDPIILYNIWDASTAKSVQDAGAKAVATGSWSVAQAQGYADGEKIPLDFVLMIIRRIINTVDIPLYSTCDHNPHTIRYELNGEGRQQNTQETGQDIAAIVPQKFLDTACNGKRKQNQKQHGGNDK